MGSKLYRRFPIHVSRISAKKRQYHVRVSGPVPGGLAGYHEEETRIYDPRIFNVESEGQSINLLDLMRSRTITASQLYHLGSILSDLILPGSIQELLRKSLRTVRERKEGLRIRLIIEARELVPLPWEYLYLRSAAGMEGDDLDFLALQPDVSIVRHEAIDAAEPRLEPRERYRLVAALAAPGDQPRLKIEQDRKAIERMIAKITDIGVVEAAWIERAGATRKALREVLREPADIFHFAGHGYFDPRTKTGKIILDKGNGTRSDFYGARALANLLRQAGVKLAVLGACETAERSDTNVWGGVAPALVRAGVAAVVASQYRIRDRNAIPLAEELYQGVLAGDSIDEAVSNARLAIYQQAGLENRDWGAPVLYLRVEDGVVFPRHRVPGGYLRAVPRIVPTPLQTPLVGRDDELAQLQASLGSRKYYVYGDFGVGKTSLATELFTRAVEEEAFSDGYLWCGVSDMDVERVLEWVASHFPDQKVAQAQGPEAKISALSKLLAKRSDCLIGLDEVRDARVARALLKAAGDCTVILNGPRRLDLGGRAQESKLAPLNSDEAEQLFVGLANLDPATIRENERRQIQRICKKMRYLPLAVKLAAFKHAEGESLDTLWQRLQIAPTTIIPEQEEVSTIFETIYRDLETAPAAQRLLVRLASFPALEATLTPPRPDKQRLDFFLAKDKLIALGMVSPAGPDRLALHPLLGILAQQNADPKTVEIERQRAASWLRDYAQKHRDDYNALEREHANLLGLLDRLEDRRQWDDMIALMRNLFHYLRVRGQWQEAFQRLDSLLSAIQEVGTVWNQGWVYLHRGIMHLLRADYGAAQADFDQADRLYAEGDDLVYRGKVLYRRAALSQMKGELSQAQEQLERALEWMGEEGPIHDRAGAHERLASIFATQGHLEEAEEQYHLALELGDREEQARVHIALGDLARQAGEYEEARHNFERARELTLQLGHVLYTATLEQEIGYVHYYQGRYDDALRYFEAAQAIFQQLKYQPGLAQTLHALGNVAFARSDLDAAGNYYQDALSINQALDLAANAAYNQYQLAVVAHRQGQRHEAEDAYREVWEAAEEMDDVALQAAALFQLGSLAIEEGDHELAADRISQALERAWQVKDRLTEASALFYKGLLQAQEGHLDAARETLAIAHASFVALNSVDAATAGLVLDELARLAEDSGVGDVAQPADRIDVVMKPRFRVLPGKVAGAIDVVKKGHVTVEIISDVVVKGGDITGAKIDRIG